MTTISATREPGLLRPDEQMPRLWTLTMPTQRWKGQIERKAYTNAVTDPNPSIETLQILIDFDEPDSTHAFLRDNSFLNSIVLDAYVELTRSFGAIQPRMTLVENPEEPRDRKLYLLASVGGPLDEARRRLAAFDETYWREAVMLVRGLMNVDVEIR